jgi:hypothetical protein
MPTCRFKSCFICAAFLSSLAVSRAGLAADVPAADRPIHEVIDHFVDARIRQQNVESAKPADDLTFVRRVTLDLAGRIPTTAEVRGYVDSSDTEKKTSTIDRLLDSPDFAYHQRNELDAVLMEGKGTTTEWRQYLLEAVRENRPWNQMFREMMLGREDDPKHKTALTFLKVRAGSVDDMTNDASRIFFGVAINCAKCHDHPLVLDWQQDHYFGFTSFFSRTYLTKKGTLAEKHSGEVKFKTTGGKEKQAKFMFLTGATIEEPKVERSADQRKKDDAEVKRQMKDAKAPAPTPPAFSPRTEFVKLALADSDSPYFARSIINRTWARLMGQGLVHPLEQMHSENEPSHPELLDWLTRDLMSHNYNLRRLVRGIVLSSAYARSSRWEGAGEPPAADLFAVAMVRPLTPEQYALSLQVATSNPNKFPLDVSAEEWAKQRESMENGARGFASKIERPSEHFLVSVGEALLFSNSEQIERDFLRDSGDRLVGALKTIENRQQMIETAFWAVNSRPPAAEEMKAMETYLTGRNERPIEALKQMVWSLITGPELRFNY